MPSKKLFARQMPGKNHQDTSESFLYLLRGKPQFVRSTLVVFTSTFPSSSPLLPVSQFNASRVDTNPSFALSRISTGLEVSPYVSIQQEPQRGESGPSTCSRPVIECGMSPIVCHSGCPFPKLIPHWKEVESWYTLT